jgi:hypothetical protein
MECIIFRKYKDNARGCGIDTRLVPAPTRSEIDLRLGT